MEALLLLVLVLLDLVNRNLYRFIIIIFIRRVP